MMASGACKRCCKIVELDEEKMSVLPKDYPRCPDCNEMLVVVGGGRVGDLIENLQRSLRPIEDETKKHLA